MTMNRKRMNADSPSPANPIHDTDEESFLRRKVHSNHINRKSPASLAKALLHKICLVSIGGEGREGVIGLLKDIAGGIILGALGMSILLLLDYSNIINLETARVFRKTAADVFSSPEILEIVEDEFERKLISVDAYKTMKNELSDSRAVIDNERTIVAARTAKEISLKAELETVRVEYDKLVKQTGLDVFCPTCNWGMGMNCQQRVNYMLEKYSDSATTVECMAKLVDEGKVKNGKCLKP